MISASSNRQSLSPLDQNQNSSSSALVTSTGLRQRKNVSTFRFPTASLSLGTASGSTIGSLMDDTDKRQVNTPPPLAHEYPLEAGFAITTTDAHKKQPTSPPFSPDNWVLVYGSNDIDTVMQFMKNFGSILRCVAFPGNGANNNSLAIEYASLLEAEKALCQVHVRIPCPSASGQFLLCGVKRIDPSECAYLKNTGRHKPSLFSPMPPLVSKRQQLHQQRLPTSATIMTATSLNTTPEMNEGDILMLDGYEVVYGSRRLLSSLDGTSSIATSPSNRSLCEKIWRWFLSIPE